MIILFLLIGLLIPAGLFIFYQVQTNARLAALATATAEAKAASIALDKTAVARSQLTATSEAIEQATAVAYYASATAQTEATIAAHAQAHATAQALDRIANSVYGPSQGALKHSDDYYVSSNYSGVQLRNFIAEARFQNPVLCKNPSEGIGPLSTEANPAYA